jgi:hypothetical protein
MPVDTKTCEFRTLRFGSLDEMLAEADRLAAAEQAGTLTQCGNWSLGTTLGHLAGWMEFALDGYPPEARPPWFIKLLLKGKKNKIVAGPMPRGFRIPGMKNGTLCTAEMPTAEAAARLRRAAERLKSTAPTRPNPVFGPMTHEEWIAVNLRHADLHLGYFQSTSDGTLGRAHEGGARH